MQQSSRLYKITCFMELPSDLFYDNSFNYPWGAKEIKDYLKGKPSQISILSKVYAALKKWVSLIEKSVYALIVDLDECNIGGVYNTTSSIEYFQ